MGQGNVMIQTISRGEVLVTVFAGVQIRSREVNVFNVLPKISPVIAFFSTNSTLPLL